MPILDGDRFAVRLREATRRGLLIDALVFAAAPVGPLGVDAGIGHPWPEAPDALGCLAAGDGNPGAPEAEDETALRPQQPGRHEGGPQ